MTPQIQHLAMKLREFRAQQIDVDELQRVLWSTSESLTSRDDRVLRERLQGAEGQVELIRFTVEEPQIRDEVLKVVTDIEKTIGAP